MGRQSSFRGRVGTIETGGVRGNVAFGSAVGESGGGQGGERAEA